MRVLLVTSEAPPIVSGISRCIGRLSEGLTRRGHDVDVLSSVDMPRLVLGEYRLSSFVAHWSRLSRRLSQYDVVNLHGPVPTLSDAFLFLAGRLPSTERPALVYTHHCAIEIAGLRRLCSAYDAVHRRLSRVADLVITTSPAYAREYEIPGARPVDVVPLGVDPRPDVHRDAPVAGRTLGVLFVGQMRPYKGVKVLLRAVARVPGVRLTLVGEGPERQSYQALAAGLGLGDRVAFLGRLPDDQLRAEYARHDVIALPSVTRAEAFGLVVLEGMAAGCVPVVSDLPGVRDLADGVGAVVPPQDVAALARALHMLSADRVRLRSQSAAATSRARGLSWTATVERYERAFGEVVASSSRARAAAALSS